MAEGGQPVTAIQFFGNEFKPVVEQSVREEGADGSGASLSNSVLR